MGSGAVGQVVGQKRDWEQAVDDKTQKGGVAADLGCSFPGRPVRSATLCPQVSDPRLLVPDPWFPDTQRTP